MPTPHNAQYVAGHIRCGKSIRCVRRGGDWKRKHGRDAVTPRNRKGEATGNTNCDLNRRASLRPYRGEATNRVLLGRKSPGCPAGVFAAVGTIWGASKLGGRNITKYLQPRKTPRMESFQAG